MAGQVRQTHSPYPEGSGVDPRLNRRAEQIVVDFWTQMLFDGRLFHLQFGTEDAPVAATGAIDDQLAMAVVDQASSNLVLLPFAAQAKVANWSTSTLFNAMLEADFAKVRYASGGTAIVPRNMRSDTPYTFQGAAYVSGASDVVLAAKSAGTDSVEFFRGNVVEDAQATPDAAAADIGLNYSARNHPLVAIVGVGSLALHFGATTADPNVYGMVQVVQIDKANFV